MGKLRLGRRECKECKFALSSTCSAAFVRPEEGLVVCAHDEKGAASQSSKLLTLSMRRACVYKQLMRKERKDMLQSLVIRFAN
jgi:hypothetical protein